MPDFRSYCPILSEEQPEIRLSADESHHLVSSNRARTGDPVVVFDGNGKEWTCKLVDSDKRHALLQGRSFIQHPPPIHEISLAQAIPKGKGLENIIRKATEIGIQHIYPILSDRTEAKIPRDRLQSKLDKWVSSSIEGAKQSGNPFLPTIHNPQGLDQFIESSVPQFATRIIASLQAESVPLKRALGDSDKNDGQKALILIGPEGDFSDPEYARIDKAGFQPVTLGPYVLKCETAAVSALSILRHEFDS